MGRQPEGAQALTGAEREGRYRTRRKTATDTTPPPQDPPCKTWTRRWDAPVSTLVTMQAEHAAWLEAMPEPTRESLTAEAWQAIVDLDLGEIDAIRPSRGAAAVDPSRRLGGRKWSRLVTWAGNHQRR